MDKAIVVLADGWGSKFGGINSVNYDLCIELGKLNKCKVICICVDATISNIEDAKKFNVELVSTTSIDFFGDACVDLSLHIKNIQSTNLYWIGHDVKTGFVAAKYKKKYNKGNLVVFHHMDYQEISRPRKSSVDSNNIIDHQDSVFADVDYIVSVGPKLYKVAEDRINRTNSKAKLIKFIPGLCAITPIENSTNNFSAITFGRIESDNDIVKQTILGVRAFSRYAQENSNIPHLTLLGVDSTTKEDMSKKEHELSTISEEEANCYVQCTALPYTEDREGLFNKLRTQSVAMMLSLSEGFGLVGLESIAAGVPLILSENSGLFEYLKELNLDFLVHSVKVHSSSIKAKNEMDIDAVEKSLRYIAENPKKCKLMAMMLLRELKHVLSWSNSCEKLLYELGITNAININKNPDCEKSIDHTGIVTEFMFKDFSYCEKNGAKYFGKKFETTDFYNIILNNADKRLWILGRKNKKLFEVENRFFFQDLKRKILNGFDFKCLFLDPESVKDTINTFDRKVNFIDNLLQCARNAVTVLNKIDVEVETIVKVYDAVRESAILVVDDQVIVSHITYDSEGYIEPLTNSDFYVFDFNSPFGQRYYHDVEKIWNNAKKLKC